MSINFEVEKSFETISDKISSIIPDQSKYLIDSVSICLIGSGAAEIQGLDIQANDLDFYVKFNFNDPKLETVMYENLGMNSEFSTVSDDMMNNDLSGLKTESLELFSALENAFSCREGQEAVNLRITGSTEVDATIDPLMNDPSPFTGIRLGKVDDIVLGQKVKGGVNFKSTALSLDKLLVKKLSSTRDKDQQHAALIANHVSVDKLVPLIKSLVPINVTDSMTEMVDNLSAVAFATWGEFAGMKIFDLREKIETSLAVEEGDSIFPVDEYDEFETDYSRSEDYDEEDQNDWGLEP